VNHRAVGNVNLSNYDTFGGTMLRTGLEERMLTSAELFQLLNESIVLLLGALLILLAVSGRVGLPTRPAALIAVGIVFLY